MRAAVLFAFSVVIFASIVSGQGESKELQKFFRIGLLGNVHSLDETTELDGCIGKQTVELPVPVNLQNLTISSVWMDGFLNYKIVEISGHDDKMMVALRFPEIMVSAHVAPDVENGTMLMMDFRDRHLSIEFDFKYTANRSHVILIGHRILTKAGPGDKPGDTFVQKLRNFVEGRIDRCSRAFAAEVDQHMRRLLRSTPFSAISSGSAHIRSSRKPRQTSQLNRIIDRFLRSVEEELNDELGSLRLISFRMRFRRLQLGGPDAGASAGYARFTNGRLTGVNRLRRYRNARDYERNGRWYVRVALRVPVLNVRYRGRFRERDGVRESDEINGRVRTVRMLWLMSQDSRSSGATKVSSSLISLLFRFVKCFFFRRWKAFELTS